MTEREATCACGDLRVTMTGEPLLVSSCCCTRCQRRTGSFFGVTVYFAPEQMTGHAGEAATFRRPGAENAVNFCPRCGSSLWWKPDDPDEGWIGVAGGCFADVTLPSPVRMTNTEHRHPFVRPPPGLPTYDEGPPD